MVIHSHIVSGCFSITMTKLSSCNRLYGSQMLKYLLSELYRKGLPTPALFALQSVIPGPGAPASFGSFLELQNLDPHLKSTESV